MTPSLPSHSLSPMSRTWTGLLILLGVSVIPAAAAEVALDLARYDPACGIRVERRGDVLRAEWDAADGTRYAAGFRMAGEGPLIASLETALGPDAPFALLARDVRPEFVL